jgi:bleomycin hydrolase
MDQDLYDYKAAFGVDLGLTKAERLQTGESQMTHAMVITAYHTDDHGDIVRLRVENSWGPDAGAMGWFMMTRPWFREFVYQVSPVVVA